MVPGSSAVTFQSDSLGGSCNIIMNTPPQNHSFLHDLITALKVSVALATPSSAVTVSLEPQSQASFTIPGADLPALGLAGSVLVSKAVHWAVKGADARPWLNSSIGVLSNLTSLELGTQVNRTLRMVRPASLAETTRRGKGLALGDTCLYGLWQLHVNNLTNPVTINLPARFVGDDKLWTLTCPQTGGRQSYDVMCLYKSGRTAKVVATCDGAVPWVKYRCPPSAPPECGFWKASSSEWDNAGLTTQATASSGVQGVTCKARHLTTFAALGDTVTDAGLTLTMAVGELSQPDVLKKSLGLVLAGKFHCEPMLAYVCVLVDSY